MSNTRQGRLRKQVPLYSVACVQCHPMIAKENHQRIRLHRKKIQIHQGQCAIYTVTHPPIGPIGLEEEPIGLFFTTKRKEKNCAKPHGCSVLRARVCTEISGSSLSIAVKGMLHRIQREQLWCLNSISCRNLKRRNFTMCLHAKFSSVWK